MHTQDQHQQTTYGAGLSPFANVITDMAQLDTRSAKNRRVFLVNAACDSAETSDKVEGKTLQLLRYRAVRSVHAAGRKEIIKIHADEKTVVRQVLHGGWPYYSELCMLRGIHTSGGRVCTLGRGLRKAYTIAPEISENFLRFF